MCQFFSTVLADGGLERGISGQIVKARLFAERPCFFVLRRAKKTCRAGGGREILQFFNTSFALYGRGLLLFLTRVHVVWERNPPILTRVHVYVGEKSSNFDTSLRRKSKRRVNLGSSG